MKIDLRKNSLVSRLFTDALTLLKPGLESYSKAESIADEIESMGYHVHSSSIYMELGKLAREKRLIDKARDIITPIAEQRCREGMYLEEASMYKRVGLIKEDRKSVV